MATQIRYLEANAAGANVASDVSPKEGASSSGGPGPSPPASPPVPTPDGTSDARALSSDEVSPTLRPSAVPAVAIPAEAISIRTASPLAARSPSSSAIPVPIVVARGLDSSGDGNEPRQNSKTSRRSQAGTGSPKSKSSPGGDDDQQPARFSTILDSVARAIGSSRGSLGPLQLPNMESAPEDGHPPGSPGGGAERPKSTSRQKRYSFERPGRDTSPASASPILGPNGLMSVHSPQGGPKDGDLDAEAMLREFSSRYDLPTEATSELRKIMAEMTTKAAANGEAAPPAITYQWDQIHELIVTHSPGTSLVMVNMPDPPDMGKGTPREQMKDMLDYMNYMEGVAENLPRVMYVHGSGQEIINFDRME